VSAGPPDARRAGKTLAQDMYQTIRAQILSGRLTSGERLDLSRLAKAHGVSPSVVREAVTRLAAERLLESMPQVGYRVRVLSIDDLVDLTSVRIEIETLALRESLANGDLQWEAQLVAAHHALASTPTMTDEGTHNLEWLARHAAFHEALCAACPSKWLLHLREQLFAASELYRFWFAQVQDDVQPKPLRAAIIKEHKALLDAALARDVETATDRLARHFQKTSEVIRANADRLGLSGDEVGDGRVRRA
jgi:GntR family carbon starvation induced transcriptional regulator